MENTNQAPPATIGVKREPSSDPVKAQGILKSVSKKEKHAARLWQQRWGFLSRIREVQEEEAQRIGMSLNEYRAAVRSVSCKPEKEISVDIDPSPTPLPLTSAGIIGRRAKCGLERFGPQVKTVRDYPIRPPIPTDQIYDPYKQTMIFLGIQLLVERQLGTKKEKPRVYTPQILCTWIPTTTHDGSYLSIRSVEGDPISYKLPPTQREVLDEMWSQPQQLCISSFPFHRVHDHVDSTR